MPMWTSLGLLGSRRIVCMHRPPAPGCHFRECSWLLIPGTISQVSPPSKLLKRLAGSTPAQISFFPGPTSKDQIFCSVRPSPSGNFGADFVSFHVFPMSVDLRIFIPNHALQLEAYITGLLPRVSTSVLYTATPEPNGPLSVNLPRDFDASATKPPFRVPIVRMTFSGTSAS